MFDHVNDALLKGESINSQSLMKSSKSFMLRVNLEPPNFSELLLMTLKSPPTHPIFFNMVKNQLGVEIKRFGQIMQGITLINFCLHSFKRKA